MPPGWFPVSLIAGIAVILLFLLTLPVARAAQPNPDDYQETAWETLIPEEEQIRDVEDYLNGQATGQTSFRKEAHGNPALQGRAVMMRGFVVPLEREERSGLREFLLVPYFGACIHMPPPPANQIVHVRMEEAPADIQVMTPVTVYGRLSLEGFTAEEGNAAYQLRAHGVEVLQSGNSLTLPVMLTLFCGLSAGIGALVAFFIPKTRTRAICFTLGFSAGVMLWLGFSPFFRVSSGWQALPWFLAGILLVGMPEWLLHRGKKPEGETGASRQETRHTGKLSALAVAVHGFPECLAVFSAALIDPVTGMVLCGVMMAHHLPLGLSIALPLRQSLGYWQSVAYAFLAGLFPAVTIIATYLFIKPVFSPNHLGLFFSLAGGIMVFIAAAKLIPSARSYGSLKTLSAGLIAGLLFPLFVLLYILSF
jgi:ZIP family zinc transporter